MSEILPHQRARHRPDPNMIITNCPHCSARIEIERSSLPRRTSERLRVTCPIATCLKHVGVRWEPVLDEFNAIAYRVYLERLI